MLVYYRTYTSLKTLAKLHIGKNFTFSKLNAIFLIKQFVEKENQLELYSQYNWKNFRITWRLFEMCFNCSDVEGNKKVITMLPLV